MAQLAAHLLCKQGVTGSSPVASTLVRGLFPTREEASRRRMQQQSTVKRPAAQAVHTPLAPAHFSPLYGMLTDRYGVTWIVGVDASPAA